MKNEDLINNLSEEVKKKLSECKTQKELKQVLAEAGVEPLDDDLVEGVAGGLRGYQDLDFRLQWTPYSEPDQ